MPTTRFHLTIILLLAAMLSFPESSMSSNKANPEQAKTKSAPAKTSDLVSFSNFPTNKEEIALIVENSLVKIDRSTSAKDIVLSSNCPCHWNVGSNSAGIGIVRQVGFDTTARGVALRADEYGSLVILGGKVYKLPQEGGQIRNLRTENGQAIVNGKPLEPLAGSDKAGPCTGPETLSITFPASYKGNLRLISYGGKSNIKSWQNGDLNVKANGTSQVEIDSASDMNKVVLDISASSIKEGATISIGKMNTKIFVANVNGLGNIKVDNGKSGTSNATVSGGGKIFLKGKFDNLLKDIKGDQSHIEVVE